MVKIIKITCCIECSNAKKIGRHIVRCAFIHRDVGEFINNICPECPLEDYKEN